jgi:hypothetical protein
MKAHVLFLTVHLSLFTSAVHRSSSVSYIRPSGIPSRRSLSLDRCKLPSRVLFSPKTSCFLADTVPFTPPVSPSPSAKVPGHDGHAHALGWSRTRWLSNRTTTRCEGPPICFSHKPFPAVTATSSLLANSPTRQENMRRSPPGQENMKYS